MLSHMPQQLNNREMCKIVPWSDDHFSYKGNTYCPKILIMGSKTICEVHFRFVTGVMRKLPATCNVYAATVWPVLVTEAISSLPHLTHVSVVIMSAMASRVTGVAMVCSIVCSGADHRKHQSSASLAFVRRIHRRPWKILSFDDVIMTFLSKMNAQLPFQIFKHSYLIAAAGVFRYSDTCSLQTCFKGVVWYICEIKEGLNQKICVFLIRQRT